MDLLFTEYASPFSLLDNLISCSRLNEWVKVFSDKNKERKRYDYFIHKLGAFDERTWEQFNEDCDRAEPKPIQKATKNEIETTIQKSFEIAELFRDNEERW